MRYHFILKKEANGYWASCIELKGCVTQGASRKEVERNMEEALNLFLAEPPTSMLVLPLPKKRAKGKNILQVSVDPKVALAFVLRKARLENKLTQKEAAALIGLKGLYSYQRLESGRTANPEFETLVKIKRAFPEINLDELVAA